jgi:hypothetical protein
MAGEFILTSVGLAAATTASQPGGISVKLTTFKVGSGSGYTPNPSDTALRGSVLYTGTITGYIKQPDGSLLVSCVLPAGVGPFTFGEIGIYDDLGNLFALSCLPVPITKTSSLNSGFGATYTFNGLLKLGSSSTIIQIPGGNPLEYPVQYVTTWAALEPAPLSGPSIYVTIISEVDNKGDYSTLVRKNDGKWSIQSNYFPMRTSAVISAVAVNKSFLTIPIAAWLAMVPGDTSLTIGAATSFVVKAPNGYFAQANASLASGGTLVQFTFTELFTKGDIVAGQTLKIWSNYPL